MMNDENGASLLFILSLLRGVVIDGLFVFLLGSGWESGMGI